MPFQRVPNTMRLELRFLQNGAITENVLGVQAPDGIDAATLVDCANAAIATVVSSWLPRMHISIGFIEVCVTNLDIENGSSIVVPAPAASNGTVGGFRLPNEVSLAVRMRATEGGRNGSGRLFWQGVADGQVIDTNFITTVASAAIVDAIQELIDALQTIGLIVVIISRYLNKSLRAEAVTFGPVTPSLFDRTLDSQRRRKPGNGS